jgi:hypothetical protein
MPLVWAAMATQDRRGAPDRVLTSPSTTAALPLGREISCSLAGRLSALFANMRGMRELHARASSLCRNNSLPDTPALQLSGRQTLARQT